MLQSARCRWRALRVTLTQVNALVKVQVASQIEFLLRHKAAAAKNEAQRLEVILDANELLSASHVVALFQPVVFCAFPVS